MTGEDSEGEEININKIDAALKTVGISLKDFLNGQKGLDDILLELAGKWDTLDLATQRYIATMAAGSRQQSRFLAMMSDYDRTMELVDAANNSAGASQAQFEKTTDSLETALNRLSNAWNEFTMNLANHEAVSGAVNALTGLLEILNSITSTISGDNGLAKSITSIMMILGGLKLGKNIFNSAKTGGFIAALFGKQSDIEKLALANGKDTGRTFGVAFSEAIQKVKIDKNFWKKLSISNFTEKDFQKKFDFTKLVSSNITSEEGENLKNALLPQLKAQHDKNVDGVKAVMNALENNNFSEAADAAKKYNVQLQITGEQAAKAGLLVETFENDISKMSSAMFAAGVAANLLATGISKLGPTGEKIATIVRDVGVALMLLPPILKIIQAAAASAGITIQAAFWPITIVVAAIGGLIGVITVLNKIAKENSLESRMEAAAEAAENAKKSAEEAKSAYDALLESKNDYTELQEQLEGLTKGTDAWKEKLIEANQQVLELLSTYPELAQYIQRGAKGQLTISQEGFDALADRQYEVVKNTQSQMIEKQINQELLNQESYFKNFEDFYLEGRFDSLNLPIDTIMKAYQSNPAIFNKTALTKEDFVRMGEEEQRKVIESYGLNIYKPEDAMNNMLELFDDGEVIYKFSDDLIELARTSATSVSKISELSNGLAQYNNLMDRSKNIQSGLLESMITSNANAETSQSKFFSKAVTGYTNRNVDDYAKKVNKRTEELLGDNSNNNITRIADKLRGEIGSKITDTTGSLETFQQVYAQLMGIEVSNIDDSIKDSKDKLAKAIAEMDVSDTYTYEVETLIKNLEKAAAGGKKKLEVVNKIADIYGNEGQGLTQNDITGINNYIQDAISKKPLGMSSEQAQGYAVGNYLDQVGLSLEQLGMTAEEFISILTLAQDTITNAYTKLDETYTSGNFVGNLQGLEAEYNLSSGQIEAFSEAISQVGIQGGNATEFISSLTSILAEANNLSPDTFQKILNILTSTDWTAKDSVENTIDAIEDLGLKIDDDLTQQLILASNALGNLNLDRLETKLESLDSVIKTVEGKIDNEEVAYTEEEVEALKDAGVDITDFVRTGFDEYTYIGNNTNILLAQLNGTAAAILGEMSGDLKGAVASGEKASKYLNPEEGAVPTFTLGKETLTAEEVISGLIGGRITINEKSSSPSWWGKTDYTLSREDATKLAKEIGYDGNTDMLSNEALANTITSFYNDFYLALEENRVKLEQFKKDEGFLNYYSSDRTQYDTLQNATNEPGGYGADTILAEASAYGAASEEVEKYNALKEKLTKNADAETKATTAELLKQISFATALEKGRKAMEKYGGAIGDTLDNLEDIEEGTDDYQKTIDELEKQTEKYMDVDLSDDFLEQGNNLELLKEAMDGSQDSWEQFIKNIDKDSAAAALEMAGLANEGIDVGNIVTALDGLDFDINGTTDMSQVVASLINAGKTAEDVANFLEKLGYSNIEFTAQMDSFDPTQALNKQGFSGKIGEIKATKVEVPALRQFRGGGGGGGGGGGSDKEWENPYDHLYNLTEKINDSLRIREKLERDYDRILSNRSKNIEDVYQNMLKQIDALEKEKQLQDEMLTKRKQEATDYMSKNADLNKYGRLEYDEQGNALVQIEWDLIDPIKDEEEGQKIEDYISKLEEIRDEINDTEDGLDDIEDRLDEIYELGKEEYFDFENRILDAIVNARQKEIDELSAIDESINDINQDLIDAIQNEIDRMRQDRDNEKKEEDIAGKQRRLTYLQQDTSGANQMEILQLQNEIDEAQEDYTDTLIDQKISELQEQNDKAAEQRQKQIQIMEKQLEHDQETGALWSQVYDLMDDGLDKDKGIVRGSKLEALLKDSETYKGMSELEKMKWLGELEEQVKSAVNYLRVGRSTEGLIAKGELKEGKSITFTTPDGKSITGKLDKEGNITSGGMVYKNVYQNEQGQFVSEDSGEKAATASEKTQTATATTTTSTANKTGGTGGQLDNTSKKTYSATAKYKTYVHRAGKVQIIQDGGSVTKTSTISQNDAQKLANYFAADLEAKSKEKAEKEKEEYLYNLKKKNNSSGGGGGGGNFRTIQKFATGGVANFTGPAWLDGTPSKPELVLNQTDTKNFIQLKDILASLMNNGVSKTSESNGDNYFDVDINVESLDNDYDVEQVADKVKKLIVNDALYRNVNAINNLR